MIQFVSVSKYYNDFIAVENVSFQINDGEFVLLTGPSGSGKTTLIKMLIREEKPSAGKVYINEAEISSMRRGKVYKLRRNIGVVFQDFKLIEDKNIYENVAFALEASGKSDEEIREIVPYVLDIVGLSDKMRSFPKELSGGQKQKAAIARAISNDPDILIADEPTGNLDEKATWDIVNILQKINEWGTTVIMCTHESAILKKLQARLLLIENGSLVSDSVNKVSKRKKEDFETKLTEENSKGDSKEDSKKQTKETIEPENKTDKSLEELNKINKTVKRTEKPIKIINNEFEKAIDENYHARSEERAKSKPKLKFGLKNKKKATKETSFDFSEYGISKKTEKLLIENNYKNMQDLAGQSIERIQKIDGLSGDQLVEIEKSLNKFES